MNYGVEVIGNRWKKVNLTKQAWGENAAMIQEWFDEGETIQNSQYEEEFPSSDRWKRAMQKIRDFWTTTRERFA